MMIKEKAILTKMCYININEKISAKNSIWFAQEAMEIVRDGTEKIVINENDIVASDFKGLRTIYKILKILKKRKIQLQIIKN